MDFNIEQYISSFLIGLSTILLIYWYGTRNHGYWKKRGIPYDPPLPFVGVLLENAFKPLFYSEMEKYRKYGSIYGSFQGNKPVLSVADPKLIRAILVKDFPTFINRRNFNTGIEIFDKMLPFLRGDDWKRVRTIISPSFTSGKLKKMMKCFTEGSDILVNNLTKAAMTGLPVDVKGYFGAFSMDVIASSAFSTKIDSLNEPNNKFVVAAKNSFFSGARWTFLLLAFFPKLLRHIRKLLPINGLKFFTDVTLQIVEERKRTNQKRNDFLQLMLDTAKETEDEKLETEKEIDDMTANYGKDDSQTNYENLYSKKTLTPNELVSQSIVFLLAGQDTVSSLVSFTTYFLALNEDVQEKLIKEVDKALEENNGELTYETIQSLKYLDNVISESLRLYSPGARLERIAVEDYKLGDTGITIEKDTIVTIPVCAIHRDPKYYPNPETFDPDRFTPEERAKRDPYVYMPFGSGPRQCVAMRLGLIESKVCLTNVLSKFRFKRCAGTKEPLELSGSLGLTHAHEVTLLVEIRKDNRRANKCSQ